MGDMEQSGINSGRRGGHGWSTNEKRSTLNFEKTSFWVVDCAFDQCRLSSRANHFTEVN